MAPLFTIIFVSKLVSVEMACLLVIQNEIQALCAGGPTKLPPLLQRYNVREETKRLDSQFEILCTPMNKCSDVHIKLVKK
jgi:hypothetical protein